VREYKLKQAGSTTAERPDCCLTDESTSVSFEVQDVNAYIGLTDESTRISFEVQDAL